MLFFGMEAVAQSTDTLSCGRQRNFYYSNGWYDTCDWYLNSRKWLYDSTLNWHRWPMPMFNCNTAEEVYDNTIPYYAYQQHTSSPVKVKGVWAMVSNCEIFPDPPAYNHMWPRGVLDSTKLPEYIYLYTRDTTIPIGNTNFLTRIATERWDTLKPKKMCIQRFANGDSGYFWGTHPFVYCDLYEILFDTVLTVEGEFWIAGSCTNNKYNMRNRCYDHPPTFYLSWGEQGGWSPGNALMMQHNGPDGPWHDNWFRQATFGPFGVITDYQWLVEVSVKDTLQGSALYTAFYPDSTTQTITAVPNRGYKFSRWNDGNTDNPRSIFVTQDTAFTALFEPRSVFSVEVNSNYSFCRTTGDSIYYEGDNATIAAYSPVDNYHFSHWNDSVTDNPRTIIVTQDTAFTAFFLREQDSLGIHSALPASALFTLTPNPSNGDVTVTLAEPLGTDALLTLRDASGHEVLSRSLPRHSFSLSLSLASLPAGTYFVTLTTPSTSATQKLILTGTPRQ